MAKREPEAVPLAEGGCLVKHCDDPAVAAPLARAVLAEQSGDMLRKVDLPAARVIWCRILGVLPGSYAEYEGWAWEYRPAKGPGRGVFRAVEYVW